MIHNNGALDSTKSARSNHLKYCDVMILITYNDAHHALLNEYATA